MTDESTDDFNSDDFDTKQLVKIGAEHITEEMLRIVSSHPSVVYSFKDKPVLIYGMIPMERKKAYAWMIPTQEFYKHKGSAIRHIKKVLDDLKHTQKVQQLVTHNLEGEGVGRWLDYLGFQRKHSNKYIKEL